MLLIYVETKKKQQQQHRSQEGDLTKMHPSPITG